MAVTSHGGHLGWCDRGEGWGGPGWVERVACGFLETAMELQSEEGGGTCPARSCRRWRLYNGRMCIFKKKV